MKFSTILGAWAPLFAAVLAQQLQLQEVKHSADFSTGGFTSNNLAQVTNSGDHSNNGQPYFMAYPQGTNFEDVVKQSTGNMGDIVYNVYNAGPAPICLFGRSTNLQDGSSLEFRSNNAEGLLLQSNGTMQIRNIIPAGRGHKYNGIMYTREGCNEKCGECPGPVAVVNTLEEWTVSEDGKYWFDISLVDGYNHNLNVSVMNSNGLCNNHGTPRVCNATLSEAQLVCPPENLWKSRNSWGCMSDCKRTNAVEHCAIGHGPYKPSSKFLKTLCPAAYSWAYDDHDSKSDVVDVCEGVTAVNTIWSPIA